MTYITEGTCARTIDLEMDGTKIVSVKFNGGCNGNGKGIGAIVEGMEAQQVIDRFSGIKCGMKQTSCPDQLAKALKAYLDEY
ncbi:MAG: TIGR03905 family TSCPD domain-containing protein [Acutalibacteraceae bacterium]|nr:TIGR03905 family TSCPD domain-containing protein [Acutalibacteraceae bacterium]